MASRPLYNGSARAWVDNNPASEPLRNAFVFRASRGTIDTASEVLSNATFEAKAGVAITLNYDIRKYGAGAELGAPTAAFIRIYKEDDDNNGTSVDVDEFQSADLIGGNNLPRTGTVSFTPSKHGTYRIALEMRLDNNDFGATSDDWRVFSDGGFQNGGLSQMTRLMQADKGRLRWGEDAASATVTERGNSAPSLFAFTMNTAGTDSQEAVRVDMVMGSSQHTSTAARHTFKVKQRRNGTSTLDLNVESSIINATTHRTESKVTRINYPLDTVNTTYDLVLAIERNSVLHDSNTPQYSGLGGQAADGVWTYFTGVGAGLTLTDYKTVTKLATHVVNAGGGYANIGAFSAALYAEDGSGVPTVAEKFSFIFTDDNMTVKSLGITNARGEPLLGIFIVTENVHEASNTNQSTWGNNDANFKTNALGNQITARTVTVTTPPAGIYKLTGTAYFPGTAFGTPSNREFSVSRVESGSPASESAGKDWIAPASFSTAWLVGEDPLNGGVTKTVTLLVFDKQANGDIVFRDADFVPTIQIFKRQPDNSMAAFATPVATDIGLGQYTFQFTPDAVALNGKDVYFIAADVTVGSFKRRWGEDITVWSFDGPVRHADEVTLLDGARPGLK